MGENKTRGGCRAGSAASHSMARWVGGEGPSITFASLLPLYLSCWDKKIDRTACSASMWDTQMKQKPQKEREDAAIPLPTVGLRPVQPRLQLAPSTCWAPQTNLATTQTCHSRATSAPTTLYKGPWPPAGTFQWIEALSLMHSFTALDQGPGGDVTCSSGMDGILRISWGFVAPLGGG